MNLREFKARITKLMKEAYSLLEASGHFTEGTTSIRIDEKDPYKAYEREQAWGILNKLYDFIVLCEQLLEKPIAKGVIKKNKNGQYMLNSHVIDDDEMLLEVKAWSKEFQQWIWYDAWIEEDQRGCFLKAVTRSWEGGESEEISRNITGLEARIKNFPPIWSR